MQKNADGDGALVPFDDELHRLERRFIEPVLAKSAAVGCQVPLRSLRSSAAS